MSRIKTCGSIKETSRSIDRRALITGLCTALAAMATGAHAQLGGRPLKIIVPTSPGSSADLGARIVAERLQMLLGRTVVTENKVGAGGLIAATSIARAEPIGETIGMLGNTYLTYHIEFPQEKFDPVNDVAPVAMISRGGNVMLVGRESPFRTMDDVVKRARAKPGSVSFASAGLSSSSFHSAERFRAAAGIDLLHVPYRGSPEMVRELIAGRVDFAFVPVSVVAGYTQDGLTRALAVSGAKRSRLLPDIPTTVEAGLPNSSFDTWLIALVPGKTPLAIQVDLNKSLNAVLDSPEIHQRFETIGVEASTMNLDQLQEYVREEYRNAVAYSAANPRSPN
jgi:tripartite-type tricarboxylate transporter receptor subunit TctC